MPAPYYQLLDALIVHLRNLKSRGVRSVAVQPDTLQALRQRPSSFSSPVAVAVASPGRPAARTPRLPPEKPAAPSPAGPTSLPLVAANVPGVPVSGPAAAAGSALDPLSKAQAMQELRERASVCMKCPHLAAVRKNVVFGVGDLDAALMFVGEAPGADEDAQGEPFVGAAGQLLTRIIQTMGLSRQTVYIGNILKCRPDTPGQRSGNRKPTAEEMKTCIPYLHSQIDLIQPRVLVGLGGTAVEGLLGKTEGITKLRGHWLEYRGIPLMPTFHPSYLLRNQALTEKRKVWEDMLQVMERLGLPISEKQRGFFLRG